MFSLDLEQHSPSAWMVFRYGVNLCTQFGEISCLLNQTTNWSQVFPIHQRGNKCCKCSLPLIDSQAYRHVDYTGIDIYIHTDRQTDRQTSINSSTHIYIQSLFCSVIHKCLVLFFLLQTLFVSMASPSPPFLLFTDTYIYTYMYTCNEVQIVCHSMYSRISTIYFWLRTRSILNVTLQVCASIMLAKLQLWKPKTLLKWQGYVLTTPVIIMAKL